jgi:hypothetical protein
MRYVARLDAGGLIKPDVSGRRSRFHLSNEANIEVANVSRPKDRFYRDLLLNIVGNHRFIE